MDELVVLLTGEESAARHVLIQHLRLLNVPLRLIELEGRLCELHEEHAIDLFIRDLGRRLAIMSSNERTLLQLVVQGETNKSISMQLGVTIRAIELRKSSMMKKLDVQSATDLVQRITTFETLISCFGRFCDEITTTI